MKKQPAVRPILFMIWTIVVLYIGANCKKTDSGSIYNKPKANFTFIIKNQGSLPDTVSFTSTATNSTSLRWDFNNGITSTLATPQTVYTRSGTYNVKLVVSSQYGADSVTMQVKITLNKPTPDFDFTIRKQGFLPDTVDFVSTTKNATSLKWYFGDGKSDTANNPSNIFTLQGAFYVKLVATNAAGSDSITKQVNLTLNKPIAGFNFTTSNLEVLPVTLTTTNTTVGSNTTYAWTFGTNTSTQINPTDNFTSGGIYNIKLVATNASGSDSITKELRISPYPQTYSSISAGLLNLFAWEGDWPGNKVMILSRNINLDRATMFNWLKTMDTTYNYYKACTGRDPAVYSPTYINNHTTISDVPSTCGAGCSYVGFTGIELQNGFFDFNYNAIYNYNQFDHLCFYEFGRNFWFFGSKLDYKEPTSFPVAGTFAVWMGSVEGRDAVGVPGFTYNGQTYQQFKSMFAGYVDQYVASPNLNWGNTFAVNSGIPGVCNAADLFTSMCMRLKRDYGGNNFLYNIWKNVTLRPDAVTTQDAVDNFFLAACKTGNKNLTSLFTTWKIPLSASALSTASQYP
ncbi:MAG: PKD domain-containing protein [Sphingobacteriales bacterium]|nr:PKD domain-containing protein [Sphingobacteriales bacterium]